MKKSKTMIVCFLTPALVFFVVVFLYPICRTFAMSFFQVTELSDPVSKWRFVGIDNFIKLLNTQIFQISMTNIAKIWLFGGVLVLVTAMLFAVILTCGIKGDSFYRAAIYTPNTINAVALASMWIHFVFNKRFGLLHSFFDMLGAEQLALTDYMNGSIKFWALLAAYSFGSVGYYMLIFISGIERLPTDIFEAATIDGANRFRQFTKITLPLLRGVIRTCITFWTIGVVGFFVWSQMWTSPQASELSSITPFVYMYTITFGTQASTERAAGMGAAVGVVMTLVVLIAFFIINRLVKNDDLEF